MSTELSIIIAAVSMMCTLLSITFVIINFARSKSKENVSLEARIVKLENDSITASRLTKIETDVIYIRKSMDDARAWQKNFDKRLSDLERKVD